ncbi:pilus assembly protein TadG-related protein [Salinarimonas chemoclinalis]|uniref:pilus assembly protein TadG-related protein n=1 Tax=Salinarimonas chemoclinalis TaxID=3241599 RepID=UPI003557D840
MQAAWNRLGRDRRGGVAIAVALVLVPLLGIAGTTVDYSRAVNFRGELQKAADAAALVATSGNESFDVRRTAALTVIDTQLTAYAQTGYEPDIVPVMEDGREVAVRVSLTAGAPTTLLGVVGIRTIAVSVEARASSGRNERFDLAFVLDTTGSMAGERLAVLKSTTTRLIGEIEDRRGADDQVRISVVPFGQYVNVGLANRTQPWLDVPADHQRPTNRSCRLEREVVDQRCERVLEPARPATDRTCWDDGRAYACGSPARPARWVDRCTPVHGDRMVEQCRTTGGGWVRWSGCVGSRDAPDDTRDANYAVRIPGLMNQSCGSPILEPTTNLAAARSHIRSLSTSGETYIPAGLIWGWRALSPHAPIAGRTSEDGVPVRRYMVLVTDGRNTRSASYPKHDGTNGAAADEIMRRICRNIAADGDTGITIYTIAFEVGDPTVKQILEDCSRLTGGTFYDAADAAQLGDAMSHIGGQISRLRLTH